MKKTISALLLAAICLTLVACDKITGARGKTPETTATFLVACFGCEQEFAKEELNADFGLCQNCLLEVGAAYCKNCNEPCYTRDMAQGLCQSCFEQTQTTTAPATQEPTTQAPTEKTVQWRTCEHCYRATSAEFMIDSSCIGCYSVREGKCLRCVWADTASVGCHCASCAAEWFDCAQCGKSTSGKEMFMDICTSCYYQLNSAYVKCPLCRFDYQPHEMEKGYCVGCLEQVRYHETMTPEFYCSTCSCEVSSAEELYEGKCWDCYYASEELCINCHVNQSGGYGPSGMECAECYYRYTKFEGTYFAEYENVRITLVATDLGGYIMTYEDLNSGIVLENILSSYFGDNNVTFDVGEVYPEYSGGVSIDEVGTDVYTFNSWIEGVSNTWGKYSDIIKQ